MEEVSVILRACGITTKYKGFAYINDISENIYNNYQAKKTIEFYRTMYHVVADKYNISVNLIEQNIKTVIERCIANNRKIVEDILGYKIYKRPTNSDFLERLVLYIIDLNGK